MCSASKFHIGQWVPGICGVGAYYSRIYAKIVCSDDTPNVTVELVTFSIAPARVERLYLLATLE